MSSCADTRRSHKEKGHKSSCSFGQGWWLVRSQSVASGNRRGLREGPCKGHPHLCGPRWAAHHRLDLFDSAGHTGQDEATVSCHDHVVLHNEMERTTKLDTIIIEHCPSRSNSLVVCQSTWFKKAYHVSLLDVIPQRPSKRNLSGADATHPLSHSRV